MKKRAQVWVETVIYTLIAFVMISLVLAYAKPKIEEMQDKAIIEQSIDMLTDINHAVLSVVQGGAGNKRFLEIGIKKGVLKIDAENDKLIFELESRHTYTEPGKEISLGEIDVYTEKIGKYNKVTLTKDYSTSYNITYIEEDKLKTLNKASIPYQLFIMNRGGEKIVIDFEAA